MKTLIQSPGIGRPEVIALALRTGLGLVFVIGGWNKLSQLLDPAREAAIVATYTSPHGYINAFFQDYLFDGVLGHLVTPWGFLTALSTFELVGGLALVAGLLVRPLALIFGLMLWTFVMALPVSTVPGVDLVGVTTYHSPAILVQIRDIAMSGLMFVLYCTGPGLLAADARLFARAPARPPVDWDALGLLLRLSVAAPLVVGGVFAGFDHIQSFATHPVVLTVIGVAAAGSIAPRVTGAAVVAVMLWFIATKVGFDKSLIANLNGFKRELALLAAGAVLSYAGGGARFAVSPVADGRHGRPPSGSVAPAE